MSALFHLIGRTGLVCRAPRFNSRFLNFISYSHCQHLLLLRHFLPALTFCCYFEIFFLQVFLPDLVAWWLCASQVVLAMASYSCYNCCSLSGQELYKDFYFVEISHSGVYQEMVWSGQESDTIFLFRNCIKIWSSLVRNQIKTFIISRIYFQELLYPLPSLLNLWIADISILSKYY